MKTRFTSLVGIEHPIVQAGMAGGPTTPDLVAAVSEAGGLGCIGAGYLSADQLLDQIHAVRQRTHKPLAVNLFVPQPVDAKEEDIARMKAYLQQMGSRFGTGTLAPDHLLPTFDRLNQTFLGQIEVVIQESVPVISFTFGIPDSEVISRLKQSGCFLIGTATTVAEAKLVEAAGLDAVVAQGSEAGGHRGTITPVAETSQVGTMALVPQVVDNVSIPVIASGGIMDGRGLVASLVLGAQAVQMGTAFLVAKESGAHPAYKARVLATSEDATELTSAYSGKPARGIRTRFMEEFRTYREGIPSYPIQNELTQPIRKAAAAHADPEYMSLWAGQGLRLASAQNAADIIKRTVRSAQALLDHMDTLK